MAVLPTPGSPMRTGLFFVRRERTWMTRRISSSRPMTGSSLPSSASAVRSMPNFSSAWNLPSASGSVTRREPRTSRTPASSVSRVAPWARSASPAGERCPASASSTWSAATYSSLSFVISGRLAQDLHELGRGAGGLAPFPQRRQGGDRAVELGRDRARVGADLREHRADEPALRPQEREQQVLGRGLGVATLVGELQGGLDGLLGSGS